MTDAPDEPSGLPSERGGARRAPRVGDSGSPVGSTLSIILAVVAVVAGFLILRAITDDDSSAGDDGPATPDETAGSTPATGTQDLGLVTTPTDAPTTTAFVPTYTGATIVVANASGVGGSAGSMSTALTTQGYQGVGEPGNGTGEQLAASIVYYASTDVAAQAVAQSIANDLGGVQVAELPVPPPAEGGGVAGATVVLMLGTDAAGKTLAELSGAGAAPAGTAAPSAVPPPAIITNP